ncbi:hypothetical protein BS47DRAFT_1354824 [Hydnum rufescens UP504]|uniref:SMAD/FHA domain-containing protein n=1 Tax=Hydnum rufescens UP504 TaxID=1448309 RepID=A0A9P6AFM7_9AGAM|nr:hypothetical protein BS47DRAFT_1354824 [Hydnum rufescens UP504]
MLRRSGRRDATPVPNLSPPAPPQPDAHPPSPLSSSELPPPQTHRIRLVPHLESTRSLPFEPIIRDAIENGPILRVGRFTDRQTAVASAPNAPNALKIAFRSKVVSRGHAEIWVETGGKFFLKDTKSSSGTFLNHVRLANANMESRPFPLKDGDVIQLGIDYQGGQQEIYRCVKIKVEIGREWQAAANAFNTNALLRLNSLGVTNVAPSTVVADSKAAASAALLLHGPVPTSDCCICLFPVTVCQALFIAPCSHAFHYKCMRPMLVAHHPGFSCPLCRTFADLESDVEVELPAQYQVPPAASASIDRSLPSTREEAPDGGVELAQDEPPGPSRSMTDSQVFGDEEVEAMVTSENERTGIMEVDDEDEDDAEEEEGHENDDDDYDEAEVSAHVETGFASMASPAVPVPQSLTNGDASARPTASSQGSSSATNSDHSVSQNPIVVDLESGDDGEQEDGTDMEIEGGVEGTSSRTGTGTRGHALSGKRKRRAHG